MVAHAAVGVAIAVTSISSSNSVCLAEFENCRVRLSNARAVADTMKCTGGNLDPGKWRENQVSEFAFCVFLNHIIERVNNLCGMRGYITL